MSDLWHSKEDSSDPLPDSDQARSEQKRCCFLRSSGEPFVVVMMQPGYKTVIEEIDAAYAPQPTTTPPSRIMRAQRETSRLITAGKRGGIFSKSVSKQFWKGVDFCAEDGMLEAERLIGQSLWLEEFDGDYETPPTPHHTTPPPRPVVLPQTGSSEQRCCLVDDTLGYKSSSFVPKSL